jgi:putative tricarboxylic transport membrane protein
MTFDRVTRTWLLVAVWIAALAAQITAAVGSQPAWRPNKAVEIILPTAAGGINDQVARLMQKILQDEKLVTVPVVPINKAGGNQVLAIVYLNQHVADPHYLLYSTPTPFTNELAGITTQRYTDLAPIALLFVEHTVITVRTDSPIKNMRDLVDRLKADPGSVAFGLGARGGVNHLALSQAVKSAGVDPRKLKAAVFKTSGETLTALAGGHVDAVASSVSAAFAQAQAGTVRMLAIAAPHRMTGALANVPTLREQGMDVDGVSNWRAVFGAKGLSPAQIAFWEEALTKTVATNDWRTLIEQNNLSPQFLRSKDCAVYLEGEYAATKAVMIDLGLIK